MVVFAGRVRTLGESFREDELRSNPGSHRYDPHRRLGSDERRCADCGYIAVEGTDALAAHDAICRLPVPPRTARRQGTRAGGRLVALMVRVSGGRRVARRQARSFS